MSQSPEVRTTPAPKSAAPALRLPLGGALLTLLLIVYGLFLLGAFAPAISEPDDNGYYAQATLLAQTGHTWFIPQSNAQYIGAHWLLTPSGKYVSRYPPGLPVIIAAVYLVFGWKVAAFVNPMLAIAGVAGLYFLIKQVFTRKPGTPLQPESDILNYQATHSRHDYTPIIWALAGSLILATNPTYLHHGLAGNAHTGVACFLMWGLFFLVRWSDTHKLRHVFLAGLFLGVIPTIRYADAIMGLGAAIFMLWQIRRVPRIWRHYAMAAAGVAVPLLPLLLRNQLLMGAFWRTGYSLTSEDSGFGWNYFKESALPFLQSMNADGMGLLFGLGWAGMVTMLCVKGRRVLGAALVAMAVPMLLVYMAYYWGNGGAMTMRFMIPTFGLYILAGLWLVQQCTARIAWPAAVAAALAIVGGQFLWGAIDFHNNALRLGYDKEMLARITVAVDKVAQPGDVIVTSNAIAQQLDYVRKWKVADQSAYQGAPGLGPVLQGGVLANGQGVDAQGDNENPSPQQIAKMIERAKNYTGTLAQREQKFMADVQRWAGDHKVWIVGPESLVMQYGSNDPSVLPHVLFNTRVQLPEAPNIPAGPGGRGGPGGGGGRGGAGPGGQGGGQGGPGFQGPGGGQGFQGPGGGQGGPGPQGQGGLGGRGNGQGLGQGPGMGGQGFQGPGQGGGQGGLGRAGRGPNGANQGGLGPQGQAGLGRGNAQGPAGGQGGGVGGGGGRGGRGGPMAGLNGQTEVVIDQWILK